MRIAWLVLLILSLEIAKDSQAQGTKPVPVIFDSDMGPDYDDVGAISLLHAFADSGYIHILATIASTRYEGVAAVMDVFNTYFGRPEIPIAVAGPGGLVLKDWQHWTDSLQLHYPHSIHSNSEVPDASVLYRRLLAEAQDGSVVIITTGFLSNLAALLKSGPDQWSSLDGQSLVRKKVKKLVSMAGAFPAGKEFNIEKDASSSRYVYDHWPAPVLFSGFEIGWRIRTGLPLVANSTIHNSPVKDVFRICIPMSAQDSSGRMSWDESAVLVAVKGYKDWYSVVPGQIAIDRNGRNAWNPKGHSQFYLKEEVPPSRVADIINRLMMHQPVNP